MSRRRPEPTRHLQVDEVPGEFEALSDLRSLRVGDPGRGVYAAVGDHQIWPAMPNLERLDVLSHALTSLAPFRRLTQLRVLYAAANRRLVDISALRDFRRLEVLAVFKTSVADLRPLSGLGIRVLYAGFCKLSSVQGLACPELQRLSLPRNHDLSSLGGIEGAAGVRQLTLSETPLRRIDELEALRSLELLELAGCPIADFRPLGGLSRLRALDLSNTAFDDLALLGSLETLDEVRLEGTPLSRRADAVDALRRERPTLQIDMQPGRDASEPRKWQSVSVPSLEETLALA